MPFFFFTFPLSLHATTKVSHTERGVQHKTHVHGTPGSHRATTQRHNTHTAEQERASHQATVNTRPPINFHKTKTRLLLLRGRAEGARRGSGAKTFYLRENFLSFGLIFFIFQHVPRAHPCSLWLLLLLLLLPPATRGRLGHGPCVHKLIFQRCVLPFPALAKSTATSLVVVFCRAA